MLRSLVKEIVRRRLWPVALVAIIVAVAAPLLFLEPAPPGAPAVSAAAPAAAAEHPLPARARRLLTAGETSARRRRKPAAAAADPFRAPASHRAAAKAGASDGDTKKAAAAAAAVDPSKPVPVVIANPDGSPVAPPASPTTPSPADGAPAAGATTSAMAVDVRFANQLPGTVHRSIERARSFVGKGRVLAIFVKYSPSRDKAVFAIAPSTVVFGDVKCRRKQGVCRYVDLAVGQHVRLETLASDDSVVSRRLDVMRIERRPATGPSAAGDAPAGGSCLLGRLLTLTADDPPLSDDACAR